jgi:hypothetical protein
VDVVALPVELPKLHVEIGADALEDLLEPFKVVLCQHLPAPLGGEDKVSVEAEDDMAPCSDVHRPS